MFYWLINCNTYLCFLGWMNNKICRKYFCQWNSSNKTWTNSQFTSLVFVYHSCNHNDHKVNLYQKHFIENKNHSAISQFCCKWPRKRFVRFYIRVYNDKGMVQHRITSRISLRNSWKYMHYVIIDISKSTLLENVVNIWMQSSRNLSFLL